MPEDDSQTSSSQGTKRKKLDRDECYPTDEQLVEVARFADEEMYPALPAKIEDWRATRVIFEFCCSQDSLMGQAAYQTSNCLVIRLTKSHDMTSQEGMDYAMQCINNMSEGVYFFMWTSMPCTGGSPWQRMNMKHASAREKVAEHLRLHKALFENWKILADVIVRKNGDLALEWPRDCDYWKFEHVQEALDTFSM